MMGLVSRRFAARIFPAACLLLLLSLRGYAGGPRYVAGSTFFNSGTMGTPIVWAQGAIPYYTDQGDLSPVLLHSAADSFVASAFTQWTSIPTAGVSATLGGQLAEDVNGSNVTVNSDGSISMPADILPTAVATPVAIVYDQDGSVTDALLGQGAGSASSCFSNAAFGGPDSFSTDAHIVHGLIVLNGNCLQSASQEPDVEYRLVRVIGRIFGLDWSQTNINVLTGKPAAAAADFTGFTIMHGSDPTFCTPISSCFPNASQPKMDDQAALSRLYPVTLQNIASFTGKQIFSAATARIHGSVFFTGANGNPAQPMQGVNVIARWMDPSTGQPSETYVAASVSGFLFSGNAGNPATGFNDASGTPLSQFGSTDSSVEGFFDLAGLQILNNATSAQYQLTVEAVDPLWSTQLRPYGPLQVQPSGTAPPILVNVDLGQDVEQDIVMQASAHAASDPFSTTTYAAPAPIPASGEWDGSLSGYGDTDYFWFSGHANHTLTVQVTAMDETGVASASKALPVIGIWGLADPGTFPAPANTPSAFNSNSADTTQLGASLLQSTNFRLGIFDFRGDGRPDYRYHARVFYGDSVSPSRVPASGGIFAVKGLGFHSNTAVSATGANAILLAASANQLLLSATAAADGVRDLALSDPSTAMTSTMTGAITYGAGPNDTVTMISGANPSVSAGSQAPVPFAVLVRGPDGAPVSGATVAFSAAPSSALSACANAASCSVFTDQSGLASTRMTPLTPGVIAVVARLAPASYASPQQVQTSLLSLVSSSLDVSLASPKIWVPQGSTLDIPITTHALTNGAPAAGQAVAYSITAGSGSFSGSSNTTDSNGNSSVTLNVSAISSETDGNACVTASGVTRCQNFQIFPVAAASLRIQPVAGTSQTVSQQTAFAPVSVRVTDSATPPNPVFGATVSFQSIIGRAVNDQPIVWLANTGITQNPMPVVLASTQLAALSDINGLATSQPGPGAVPGPVLILGSASTGTATQQFVLQSLP
ncbi:MAG TPA: hypothetical protein VGG46_06880 [Terriglobales bacterium]|jgi:hypothetical protein